MRVAWKVFMGVFLGSIVGGVFSGVCFSAPDKAKERGVASLRDSDQGSQGKAQGKDPKVKVERGADGRKIFRITTGFVIEGRIQKPNAFYVLQRSQINYDWVNLRKDFSPLTISSVSRSPF